MEKAVVYCGTRNTYPEMAAACKSLLRFNKDVHVYFLIEDNKFPDPDLPTDLVTVKNVSKQKWIKPDGPNMGNMWSWMVLLRGAYARLFPKLDFILSLDNDTFVEDDISELWELDMTDYYYAAVREVELSKWYNKPYYNFGVSFHNLRKQREDKVCDAIIEELNTVKHDYPEQDVFMQKCEPHILELPGDWNIADFTTPFMTRKIRHMTGPGKWDWYPTHPLTGQYRRMTWEKAVTGKNRPMHL